MTTAVVRMLGRVNELLAVQNAQLREAVIPIGGRSVEADFFALSGQIVEFSLLHRLFDAPVGESLHGGAEIGVLKNHLSIVALRKKRSHKD